MATTIQVSDDLARKLKAAKRELGAATYEEVIQRLWRQHYVRTHPMRGKHPTLRWDKATDRMRFRTD